MLHGPTLSTRGNLVPWSAPVAQGHPRTVEHRYLPCLGCYETPTMMAKEYVGGGEDTDGDRRRSGSRQEGRAHRGEGARSYHKNTLR